MLEQIFKGYEKDSVSDAIFFLIWGIRVRGNRKCYTNIHTHIVTSAYIKNVVILLESKNTLEVFKM